MVYPEFLGFDNENVFIDTLYNRTNNTFYIQADEDLDLTIILTLKGKNGVSESHQQNLTLEKDMEAEFTLELS